jgi:hypothetical protein
MAASVPFNYMQQTVAPGTFNIQSTGYIQGMFLDDPSIRNWLASGVLASTETLPMWGGVAISETSIPNGGTNPPDSTQGGLISRATNISASGAAGSITGFSVFNQAYGMVITPQSPVPQAASGMQVDFFRLGSMARIVVAASASLSSVSGNPVSQQVSWDFVNQQLIPYIPTYAQASATAVTYVAGTGVLSLTFATAPFGASYATLGSVVSISGTAGTGAGVSSLNGTFPIVSVQTSGTVIGLQAPAGLTASGLSGSVLAAGGGALPVKVIEFVPSNCMTVVYNPATGYTSWNYNGLTAVILI